MRSHRHQGKYKERKVRRSQDNNIFFQGDPTGHELCSVHQHPHPLYFSYIVCCCFFLAVYLPLKGRVHYNKITFLLWSLMAFAVSDFTPLLNQTDFWFLFVRPSKFLQRWFRSQVSVCSPFGKGERTVKKCKVMFWQVAFDSYRGICLSECLHNINCKTFQSVRIFLCNFCIAMQIDGVVWWCRFYV